MGQVTMPNLGLTMEEGTIIRWLKKPGERVTAGEPLVEIMSDKASNVVESPTTGVLESISLAEGESAPIGAPICVIREADG